MGTEVHGGLSGNITWPGLPTANLYNWAVTLTEEIVDTKDFATGKSHGHATHITGWKSGTGTLQGHTDSSLDVAITGGSGTINLITTGSLGYTGTATLSEVGAGADAKSSDAEITDYTFVFNGEITRIGA